MHFVVMYGKGPSWSETPETPDVVQGHIAHQHAQLEAGKLVMGGPFLDEPGGMAIFKVESRDELDAILNGDPAVSAGFYAVEAKAWRIGSRG